MESLTRMSPGVRTELQLFGASRRSVRGLVERCRVSAIEPLRYEGAIVFDAAIDFPGQEFPQQDSPGQEICRG